MLECNVSSVGEDGCCVINMLDWDWPSSKLFEWTLRRTLDEIRALGARALRRQNQNADARRIEDSAARLKACDEAQRCLRDVLDRAKV